MARRKSNEGTASGFDLASLSVNIVDAPVADSTPVLLEKVQAVDESGQAGEITMPRDEYPRVMREIHKAARYLNRTARRKGLHDDGENITVLFIVKEREYRARKDTDDADTDADTDADFDADMLEFETAETV